MIGVRFSIVDGSHPFCHGMRFGPRHRLKVGLRLGHHAFFFGFHCGQFILANTHAHQQRAVCGQRVLSGPIIKQIPVNITRRGTGRVAEVEIVMVMGMAASSHGFDVNQGWTTAVECKLPRNRR